MPRQSSSPSLDIQQEVAAASKALAPAVKRLRTVLTKLDPESTPLGSLADALYEARQITKLLNTLSAPFDDFLAPKVKELEETFVQKLEVGEATGTQGRKARVQITESVVPSVEDWEAFYKYIARNKAFELLNRAVNRAAVQERWDAKKQVPGVGKFHIKKVSCTKLSGK